MKVHNFVKDLNQRKEFLDAEIVFISDKKRLTGKDHTGIAYKEGQRNMITEIQNKLSQLEWY